MSGQDPYAQRRASVGRRAAAWLRDAAVRAGDGLGLLRVAVGLAPRPILSARMALEQWKHALRGLPDPSGPPILVVATRNRRWVEWAVFSACYLLRMGYAVTLLHSRREIEALYGRRRLPERLGLDFWTGVAAAPHLRLIDLDPYVATAPPERSAYGPFAWRYAHMVAAYNLKVEEHEGDGTQAYDAEVRRAAQILRTHGDACERVLREQAPARVICPSGLIAWTVSVLEAARRVGIPAVFVEGWAMRPGHNIWNVNRPALDYDIEGWLALLRHWDPAADREFQKFVAFRDGARLDGDGWLAGFHQVQRCAKDHPLPPRIRRLLNGRGPLFLLGTNVVGDSSTLDKATIFRSQRDWVVHVIEFFRARPELRLIVRAHPDEVWQKAAVRIGDIARARAAGAPNVLAIASAEAVNTFAVAAHCDAGLAWVSNFGLDMVLHGKPVILAARAPYAGLGICEAPQSRAAYFEAILRLAADPRPPSPEAVEMAAKYQCIVFRKMSLQADSARYRAVDYRLGPRPMHPEQHTFYQILAGELSDKGQPLAAGFAAGRREERPCAARLCAVE